MVSPSLKTTHHKPWHETSQTLARKEYSMRKLLLASAAVFALSSAAQAGNTSTTVQVGVVNGASTTQNGLTNSSSSTSQLGILNSASTMQGTSAISLNNLSTVNQIGVQNTATTGQVAFGNNGSGITQNSFGPAVFQNNSASTGQLSIFGINTSIVSQTAH
jgi:major curlin subunit